MGGWRYVGEDPQNGVLRRFFLGVLGDFWNIYLYSKVFKKGFFLANPSNKWLEEEEK